MDDEQAATEPNNPPGERLDAILPLHPRDLERAERLLLPSLRHFFEPLGTCWVVVPDDALATIAPRLDDPRLKVIGENELVPELRWFRRTSGDGATFGLTGWNLQQLVKLSIARTVATPFYVTLDAEVLCCRRITAAELVPGGRALALVSEVEDDVYKKWYERSAEVLQMPRSGRTHGVTPAVLCKEAVLSLFAYLEERLRPNALRTEALLLSHRPWTEYTLYYTYLEQTGLFDRYHVPVPMRTYGENAWGGTDPTMWDPAASFAASQPRWFSVLQGHTTQDVDGVIARIRAHFASIGEPTPF